MKHAFIRPFSDGTRLALAVMVLALAGCGYSSQELYPTEYTTVAIPHFENRSDYAGVEFELREALIKETEQRTPYKVVATVGAAQTVLEVVVTDVQSDLVSRTETGGVSQELELSVTIDYAWRDLRTGEIIRGWYRGFTTTGQYVPLRQAGEFYQTAQHRAVQRMAQEVVDSMRGDGW